MTVVRFAAVVLALGFIESAAAQKNTIRWGSEVPKAIALAKKTHRPLMFWVLGRRADRDHDYERDQKRAFADPRVVQMSKRFVPAKFSRSRNPELLEKWQLPRNANLMIVFVTPDGEKIDILGPGGVANKESLAQKMSLVFRSYRDRFFTQEIKAKMTAADAKMGVLRKSLELIDEFTILSADRSVIALLDREDLDAGVRKACHDVLARLSTRAAVDALLQRAEQGDANALRVLSKCTPLAAEQMLEHLDEEQPELFVAIYEAATKICRVKKPKPAKFWGGKNERVMNEEMQRVKEIVRKTARRWRDRYEDYR